MQNRCPDCHRFGIDYDVGLKVERCPWIDCLFVNKDNIDLSKVRHPIKFKAFIEAVRKKK